MSIFYLCGMNHQLIFFRPLAPSTLELATRAPTPVTFVAVVRAV